MDTDLNQAIRDVVKGAGVVYVGLLIEYVASFLAQVIAANFLAVGQFGNIITGTAVIDLGAIAGTIGLNIGLARNLPRRTDRDARLRLANTAYLMALPLSVVVGAAIALNAQFIASTIFNDPDVAISMQVFGATVPFAVVYNLSTGGIRGQGISRYRVYLRNLLHPLSRMGLVVAAVVFGLGQTGFLSAYAIPYALVAIAATYLFSRALPGFRVVGETDLRTAKDLLSFSLPLSVSNAMGFIIRSSDIFIVLFFLNNEAVGAYGVMYALGRIVLMFSTAFNFLGMPIASKLESDEQFAEALRVNESILRWLGIVSVPVLFPMLVYPRHVIQFIYGAEYATEWLALAVLAAGFAVHNVFSANRNILTAVGRTKVIMANNILAATLNVGLNLVLIPLYGITGAAVATIASYVVRDAAVLVELKYFTGRLTVTRRVLSPLLLAVPVVLAGSFASEVLPVTIVTVVALTAVVGVAYLFVIVLVLGFAPEEVMLIRSAQEEYGLPLGPLDAVIDRFS